MKRLQGIVIILLICTLCTPLITSALPQLPYQDVKPTDWSYSSLQLLTFLQIVEGYPDNTFRPEQRLTREEWMKLMATTMQLKGISIREETSFLDVPSSRWSYPYVMQGYQYQLIDHLLQERRFEPLKAIERQEVAQMIGVYLLQGVSAKERGEWLSKEWKEWWESHSFQDGEACKAEYRPYIAYAASIDVMVGDTDGRFRPTASLNRREAVALLARMLQSEGENQDLTMAYLQLPGAKKVDGEPAIDAVVIPWDPTSKDPSLQEATGKQEQKLLLQLETEVWKKMLKQVNTEGQLIRTIGKLLQEGEGPIEEVILYMPTDLKQREAAGLTKLVQQLKGLNGDVELGLALPAQWNPQQLQRELVQQVDRFYLFPLALKGAGQSSTDKAWYEGLSKMVERWEPYLSTEKMILVAPSPVLKEGKRTDWKNEWFQLASYYRFGGLLWVP